MAFVADTRMLANVWLRPGNAHSQQRHRLLAKQHRTSWTCQARGAAVADSGFCDKAFLQHLEQNNTTYTVAMRLVRPLQHALVNATWWPLQESDEKGHSSDALASSYVSSVTRPIAGTSPGASSGCASTSRHAPGQGKSLSLFADDQDLSGWRYGAIVTNLALPGVEVWRLYRGGRTVRTALRSSKRLCAGHALTPELLGHGGGHALGDVGL